jgi:hypothetical protein
MTKADTLETIRAFEELKRCGTEDYITRVKTNYSQQIDNIEAVYNNLSKLYRAAPHPTPRRIVNQKKGVVMK